MLYMGDCGSDGFATGTKPRHIFLLLLVMWYSRSRDPKVLIPGYSSFIPSLIKASRGYISAVIGIIANLA